MRNTELSLGEPLMLNPSFDDEAEKIFHAAMDEYGLKGTYWSEK